MFSCMDCNKKYRTKPNYCDCGNNTFEETNRIPDLSVFFLIACIILSFVILLFPVKIDSSQAVEKNKTETVLPKTNIPNIDTFWNDKPAVLQQKMIEPQKQTATNITVQTETEKIKPQQIPTRTKEPTKPTQKVQSQPKPTAKAKTKIVSQPKPTQKVQPKPTMQQKTQPKVQPKTQIKQKSKAPTPKEPKISAKDSEEFYRYKIGLRQALFANLSVLSVQGKGKCGIEFFIDKNGRLTNRAFTFQSDNSSVNDEVYKMLMKMPRYYDPPKAYNGEKIKLTFEFNNGSYVINYTN